MEKTILTADEFIKFWTKEYINNKNKKNLYVDDSSSKTKKTLRFENVIIEEKIKIENIDEELIALRFVNCEIKELVINNCKTDFIQFQNKTEIGQLNIGNNSQTRFISFENSTSKNGINIWTNSVCENIQVFDESNVSNILIDGKQTNGGYIQAENSKIGTVFCDNGASLTYIELVDSKVNNFDFIGKSNIEFINIEKSIIQKFNAKNSYIDLHININDSQINYFFIQVNSLPELNIKTTFIQTLFYKNIISSAFNLRNCKIWNFIFQEMKTGKDGSIQIIECEVANLTFDKVINLASFNVSNLKPLKEASVFKYTIYPTSNFKRGGNIFEFIEKDDFEKNISFINSDLGKMLISSDLSKFDNFIFAHSKINDIFISGPKLPKIITVEGENLILQQRIAFNQLKKIYENRGDSITPLKYYREEMESYREQEEMDYEPKSISEKFQLNFNKYTNSHGTNWINPLLLTLTTSIFLFIIYCLLIFGFDVNAEINFNLIPYYFEFLNPTHKVNFIKDFKIETNSLSDNIALSIDFINRILVPLLVYQLIQAFRMYGKK